MKVELKYYVLLALTIVFSFSEIKAQNKVLILGIDGCRPDALLAAKTPHLDNLWKNGAYSFKAKTDDLSWSGVCWTGMLTGVWKDKHK
ncbi:alkaline phosphatase family protein [Gelatiniphilus marinus]|uniref:Alkaline phosphatase family protein n=1 Tax=Gelatiniphilus marinus TaxID=1759464 RepID=A0ABW5JQF1_9FLAO